jgi:hypothetical protein
MGKCVKESSFRERRCWAILLKRYVMKRKDWARVMERPVRKRKCLANVLERSVRKKEELGESVGKIGRVRAWQVFWRNPLGRERAGQVCKEI